MEEKIKQLERAYLSMYVNTHWYGRRDLRALLFDLHAHDPTFFEKFSSLTLQEQRLFVSHVKARTGKFF